MERKHKKGKSRNGGKKGTDRKQEEEKKQLDSTQKATKQRTQHHSRLSHLYMSSRSAMTWASLAISGMNPSSSSDQASCKGMPGAAPAGTQNDLVDACHKVMRSASAAVGFHQYMDAAWSQHGRAATYVPAACTAAT